MIRPLAPWVVILLASCGGGEPEGGRLELSWTGADSGALSVPAEARWCPADTTLHLAGAVGDSGAALVFLAIDSVRPGVYQVTPPVPERTRPAARVALRWLGLTMVEGFYGSGGEVTVDSGGELAGRFEATLVSVNSRSEVTVAGRFRAGPVGPGSPAECGAGSGGPEGESS